MQRLVTHLVHVWFYPPSYPGGRSGPAGGGGSRVLEGGGRSNRGGTAGQHGAAAAAAGGGGSSLGGGLVGGGTERPRFQAGSLTQQVGAPGQVSGCCLHTGAVAGALTYIMSSVDLDPACSCCTSPMQIAVAAAHIYTVL